MIGSSGCHKAEPGFDNWDVESGVDIGSAFTENINATDPIRKERILFFNIVLKTTLSSGPRCVSRDPEKTISFDLIQTVFSTLNQ